MKKTLLSLFALLCMTVSGAWAWSGSGTQADPYLIQSASDWSELFSSTTYIGSVKYYRLTADISVTSPVNRNASLQGTFDGNGHTITLNYSTSTKYDGLFPYIKNLTVKNLHVAGTITTTTTGEVAGGIAGNAQGTNYFKNCRVSITISSSFAGRGYHGGFVAAVKESGSHVYIENCSFDGTFTGANTSHWGGFFGWSDANNQISISNCYFRPRSLNINAQNFHPFSEVVTQTYNNCLYSFYYCVQNPGDYSQTGISSSAALSSDDVINTLGSDNWKFVRESEIGYVVPIWQYTVFFDANGGIDAPSAQTKKDGIDMNLSSTVPTRTGYTFTGWNTKDDGSGTAYAAGATYTANADVTLYAQWTENTKTLSESDDNSSWITANDGEVYDVTLTRTLQTGGWNTFAVPFDAAIPTGWTVKQMTGTTVSGKTLTITFGDATTIEAGKPYLVKVDAAAVNPSFADVTINKDIPGVSFDAVDFIPTLDTITLPEGRKNILFIGAANTLYHPSAEGQQMKGFRAYFVLKGEALNAQSFAIDLGDDATAIEAVNSSTPSNSPQGRELPLLGRGLGRGFNLCGQRVSEGYKGIVIVNGKKVIK